MKVVILCGGKGTRMREETEYRPKPLVLIGGKPIIWHIMKLYSFYGIRDFILCVGYKGEMIKQYCMEMKWRNNNFTIHTGNKNGIKYHTDDIEDWNITVVDTGLETLTAGRLKKVKKYIDDEDFLFTYGDGLSNVNIEKLIEFHKTKKRVATLTGVYPLSPFGLIEQQNGIVKRFKEKPRIKQMVNGGFMVLNKRVFDYLPEEDCFFENIPMRNLCEDEQLAVYEHTGFWTSIDTFKDVEKVNKIWDTEDVPWKVW